jgi:hypothetical protein
MDSVSLYPKKLKNYLALEKETHVPTDKGAV